MLRLGSSALVAVVLACAVGGSSARVRADGTAIDVDHSSLTIHVYKSGVFSAFADNHVIRARPHHGSVSATAPLSVTMSVRARDLTVLDPDLSAAKRQEVQTRMIGPEVLDADQYPDITFTSTRIEPEGQDHWTVSGTLAIHGRSRPLVVDVTRSRGLYRGSVHIKQRDFGITPISIAGGTVKVKDELLIEFEIAATS